MSCFFILSCARSGSTSLARILGASANGECVIEPVPNLNRETRDVMLGRIRDPLGLLQEKVVPRVRTGQNRTSVYGEKEVTFGPFVRHLHELTGCKFVFLKRDGRDVVRSLMDWHERLFGTIYRECKDAGRLSAEALAAAARLPVHQDTSDYSRPRPLPGDPLFRQWRHLSREEMCAYYWATVNDLYLDQLRQIPQEDWVEIDYTRAEPHDVLRVANHLGLEGLGHDSVEAMLARRINSLKDRIDSENHYPKWTQWDSGLRDRFARLAADTMQRLSFFASNEQVWWRPSEYGRFWQQHDGGIEWYTWMYNGRKTVHDALIQWVLHPDRSSSIRTIADFGCGMGVGYCDGFADRRYVGIDLSQRNVDWCRANRTNPKHDYWRHDFVADPLPEKFDLVFSSGTIDNAYDVDAFLRAMVRSSRKWVYLTCYRGWFPDLKEHRYSYNPQQKCFYNDVSPSRMRRTLEELGCTGIEIAPQATGSDEIPYETRVMAQVPTTAARDEAVCASTGELHESMSDA